MWTKPWSNEYQYTPLPFAGFRDRGEIRKVMFRKLNERQAIQYHISTYHDKSEKKIIVECNDIDKKLGTKPYSDEVWAAKYITRMIHGKQPCINAYGTAIILTALRQALHIPLGSLLESCPTLDYDVYILHMNIRFFNIKEMAENEGT